MSRVPSSQDQRHLWLAILVGALSVEVAVERRGRVVDGVPVPVSREDIDIEDIVVNIQI